MFDSGEAGRRPRPVAVLALLFGLLVALPGSGAPLRADPGTARIGSGADIRATSILRCSARQDSESPDGRCSHGFVPPSPPAIVTRRSALRPAASWSWRDSGLARRDRPTHYRARAPPAA